MYHLCWEVVERVNTKCWFIIWRFNITWLASTAALEPPSERIFSGPQQPEDLLKYIDRDEGGSGYFCTLCTGFSHKSRANVRNHVESKHFPKHFVYTCQTCGHNCPSHQSLLKHKSMFHKNLPCYWSCWIHFMRSHSLSWCTTIATLLGGAAWGDSGSADPTKLYEYVGYDAESGKHICLKCSNFSHKSRSNARNHVEAVHFPALFTYSCQVCGQETGSKNALNIHMTRFHKTRHAAPPPLWMPCLRWSGDYDGWDWGGDNVSCLSQSSGLQTWCKTAYKAQAWTFWKDCSLWTLWERIETPLGTWGPHEKSAWALFKEDCWSKWTIVLTDFVTGYVESFLEVFQDDEGSRIVCIECKKTFTNRQNARRHVRSLHSETGECFCHICNVSLTNIRTFNDHMRERHNVYKKGKYNVPQSNAGSDPLNENWK